MKSYAKLGLMGLSVFCFVPASCKKQESAPAPVASPIESVKTFDHLRSGNTPPALKADPAYDLAESFKYETLRGLLGRSIPRDVLNKINTEGRFIAELKDTPIKGARPIAIGLADQVQMMIYLKDDALVAIGYLLPAPVSADNQKLENDLLSGYTLHGEDLREALGTSFNTVEFSVRKYIHADTVNLHAAAYTHGNSRTLALYDSNAVAYETMLPSSPEVIGKEKIDKMKSEVARMEALMEQAKAEQRARQSKAGKPKP